MDTKDPRFVIAYNELVNAFFKFINIVNPAPSRQDQIRMICESMNSLVNMLQDESEETGHEDYLTPPTNPQRIEKIEDNGFPSENYSGNALMTSHSNPSASASSGSVSSGYPSPAPTPSGSASQAATAAFSEKRYAKEPILTGEEINKFLNKQIKKDISEAMNPEIDPQEYIFILEYDSNTQKGIYYLNDEVNLKTVFSGNLEKGVVVVQGNPREDSYRIVSNGKIEKSTGGWEVISPLVIGEV